METREKVDEDFGTVLHAAEAESSSLKRLFVPHELCPGAYSLISIPTKQIRRGYWSTTLCLHLPRP